jgi:hypothetical protein
MTLLVYQIIVDSENRFLFENGGGVSSGEKMFADIGDAFRAATRALLVLVCFLLMWEVEEFRGGLTMRLF